MFEGEGACRCPRPFKKNFGVPDDVGLHMSRARTCRGPIPREQSVSVPQVEVNLCQGTRIRQSEGVSSWRVARAKAVCSLQRSSPQNLHKKPCFHRGGDV